MLLAGEVLTAQAPRQDAQARRVGDRMKALQREAEQLATQSKTLLGDLRQLEIERDLRTEEARQAETAAAATERSLVTTSARVTDLEQQRAAQLPDLRRQLVDIYQRGRSGYAQLLFGTSNVRDFARATRAVASLSTVNQRRLDEHRKTLDILRTERKALEQQTNELRTRHQQAEQSRAAVMLSIL